MVFKRIPADICNNCGEYYLSDEVADELIGRRVETAIANGPEVEICRYAA
ncbi:MAG: YgiT-type zinc finger protein [Cyanobacteria bacterium J06639_14]